MPPSIKNTSEYKDYKESLHCSCCGLLQDEKPYDDFGCPTHNICPCCGIQFGYEDNTPASLIKYRDNWLKKGEKWFIPELKPKDWSFDKQFPNAYQSNNEST